MAPTSGMVRRAVTLPAAGTFSTSSRPIVASAHRSTGAALARAIAVFNVSGDGGEVSFFSGATPSTTRLSSVMKLLASADTSSTVTVGR